MLRLEEEQLSGMRAKPTLREKDESGYGNWAIEEVSNMGFSVVELGLENVERAQDEHREIEEGNSGGVITIWDKVRFEVALALEDEVGCGGVLKDDK
ncbi:hypothetical protein Gorai_000538 [Gossypium raimondii]|uniref:Uncharacterized protein n=1 Tax=Gossypium raimondii TaxID=29730 RepID=A0A7J8PE48_GOSRA|nr:hypothetical protein [Gossypium raimondii]